MSLHVVCVSCKASFRAKEEWAGKRTKCPKCAGPILISGESSTGAKAKSVNPSPVPGPADLILPPAATPAPQFPVISVPTASPPLGARPASAPPKRPPTAVADTAPKSDRSPLILAAGAGAALVLAVIGGWIFLSDRSDSQVAVPPAPPKPAATTPLSPTNRPASQSSPVVAARIDADAPLEDVVDRLKKSVVFITLHDSRGETLGVGSGFRIEGQNLFITNHHVIQGGTQARIRFSNGMEETVTAVRAADAARDLAIVSTAGTPLDCVPLVLASDLALRQGTKVIAVGHPRGLDYSVSDGIVSALRKTSELPEDARDFLRAPADQQWIQTTAAISGGNSGGPLTLPDGRVIGINTWVAGGENLGFAAHVLHIQELIRQMAQTKPQSLPAYSKANGGQESKADQEKNAFAAEYAELIKLGEAIEWRPVDGDGREVIQRAAGGAAFSNPRGLARNELAQLRSKLIARRWSFLRHVKPLNSFAIEIIESGPAPVMFFGKVVKTFDETHISRVQLVGRGYLVDVYEFTDPKKHRRIGETLVVMGMHPPGIDSEIPRVAAGIAAPVSQIESLADTTLAELRDYVHFENKASDRQALIADPKRNFPILKFPVEGEPKLTYSVTLNKTGQGFDALRLTASTRNADDDLIWAVAAPSDRIGQWGIATVDGVILYGVERFLTLEDYRPPNLTLPARNQTLVTCVSGPDLQMSRRHLLWFEIDGEKSIDLTITGVYRPKSIARPTKSQQFAALGLPEVDGQETRRRQQTFAVWPWKAAADPATEANLLVGTPLRAAE